MFKKISLAIILVLSVAVSVLAVLYAKSVYNSTDTGEESMWGEQYVMYYTFPEAIELSHCVAVAEFVSRKEDDETVESIFYVKEVLRGDIPERIIHLFDWKGAACVEGTEWTYETGLNIYSAGEDYILVLGRHDSLFQDYPHFTLVSDIFIPVSDTRKSTMYGKAIEGFDAKNDVNAVKNLVASAKAPKPQQKFYTTATELPDILNESDFVMEVKIVETGVLEGQHNGNTYTCEPLNILKGKLVDTDPDGTFWGVFIKGSVKEGDTYLVMVNQLGEYSLMYSQSSLNSVIPMTDTKTVAEVKRLVASEASARAAEEEG